MRIPDRVLKKASKAALAGARRYLERGRFVRHPRSLATSLSARVQDGAVVIRTDHPAFIYLSEGVRRHRMTYLAKAKAPIPLLGASGQVIYRDSRGVINKQGSWVHPGIQGKHFTEKMSKVAAQEASKVLEEYIKQEYLKGLKKTLKRRR